MRITRPRSVRGRITLGATVGLALTLSLSAIIVVYVQRSTLTSGVEANARQRATDVAATLAAGGTSADVAAASSSSAVIQIFPVNQPPSYPISSARPAPGVTQAEHVERLAGQSSGEDFYVVARGVRTASGNQIVLVGASLQAVTDGTIVLGAIFAVGVPLFSVLLAFVTWTVTGRALKPVARIREEVSRIEADDLRQRLQVPGTNDEIDQLAATMNLMLSRLDAATSQQRRFVADASHELRSPLTAIRTRLEVDLAYPHRADWHETQRIVLDEAARLEQLTEDLLALARFDATEARRHEKTIDLDEIVLEEVKRLRAYSSHRIDASAVSGAQLVGDHGELVRLVRNLLSNANRHAVSAITIALTESADIVLSVADDGPGIPAGQELAIFERFTRLDDARTRDAGGAGLGLAIVHEITQRHGGSVTVENVPGARFTIRLPLPARSL